MTLILFLPKSKQTKAILELFSAKGYSVSTRSTPDETPSLTSSDFTSPARSLVYTHCPEVLLPSRSTEFRTSTHKILLLVDTAEAIIASSLEQNQDPNPLLDDWTRTIPALIGLHKSCPANRCLTEPRVFLQNPNPILETLAIPVRLSTEAARRISPSPPAKYFRLCARDAITKSPILQDLDRELQLWTTDPAARLSLLHRKIEAFKTIIADGTTQVDDLKGEINNASAQLRLLEETLHDIEDRTTTDAASLDSREKVSP